MQAERGGFALKKAELQFRGEIKAQQRKQKDNPRLKCYVRDEVLLKTSEAGIKSLGLSFLQTHHSNVHALPNTPAIIHEAS